jgi:RHS repeat-associated protein
VSGLAGALPAGITLTGNGGLDIAGLEWLGARAYDPATRGFLSTDPLAPVLGAGWDGNPYAYAGNNPLNTTDPTGLRPLTDDELKAYDGSSRGAFAAAGDWLGDNWEYVAAGAAIAAGVALMFTGVGGPVGIALIGAASGALISGGISVATQEYQAGSVDWGKVGVDAAIGALAGGLGAGTGAIVSQFGGKIATSVVGGSVEGGVSGVAMYSTGPGPHTVGGLLQSGSQGAAVGGIFGAAGHLKLPTALPTTKLQELAPNPYAGVQDASAWLQSIGVPRQFRQEALQSFVPGTISLRTAGAHEYGLRYYGGGSEALGRYITPNLPATRSDLALPSVNTMEHLAQFKIAEGSNYLSGRVGPNFGYPGGGIQHYLPDPSVLTRME